MVEGGVAGEGRLLVNKCFTPRVIAPWHKNMHPDWMCITSSGLAITFIYSFVTSIM